MHVSLPYIKHLKGTLHTHVGLIKSISDKFQHQNAKQKETHNQVNR